eukprot:TRINITY_DN2955_c0_g1_i1.p1 TRINITY_DN2955_c0_g1~~TRINITY_DN2955_c0_g1_i1.p1  ORF type:complete len:1980 (-),score=520.10 TRINITY_DN2955_c0_g1_i1:398-6337(-)
MSVVPLVEAELPLRVDGGTALRQDEALPFKLQWQRLKELQLEAKQEAEEWKSKYLAEQRTVERWRKHHRGADDTRWGVILDTKEAVRPPALSVPDAAKFETRVLELEQECIEARRTAASCHLENLELREALTRTKLELAAAAREKFLIAAALQPLYEKIHQLEAGVHRTKPSGGVAKQAPRGSTPSKEGGVDLREATARLAAAELQRERLASECDSLRTQHLQSLSELDLLRKERAHLVESEHRVEAAMALLREESLELRRENERLGRAREQLAAKAEALAEANVLLQGQLQEARAASTELKEQLHELQDRYVQLTRTLHERQDGMGSTLEALLQEIATLRASTAEQFSRQKSTPEPPLGENFEDSGAASPLRGAAVQQLLAELSERRQECCRLTERLDLSQKDAEGARRELAEAQMELRAASQLHTRVTEDAQTLRQQSASWGEERRMLEAERAALQQINASLHKQLTEQREHYDTARTEAEELSRASQRSSRDRHNSEQELAWVRRELERLEAQALSQGRDLEQARTANETLKREAVEVVQNHSRETAELRVQLAEALERGAAANAETQRVRELFDGLHERVGQAARQEASAALAADAVRRAEEAQREVATWMQRHAAITALSDEQQSSLQQLRAQLDQERSEVARWRVGCETHQKEVEELRAANVILVRENAVHAHTAELATKERDSLLEQLRVAKEKLREQELRAATAESGHAVRQDELERASDAMRVEAQKQSDRLRELQAAMERMAGNHAAGGHEHLQLAQQRCHDLEVDKAELQRVLEEMRAQNSTAKQEAVQKQGALEEAQQALSAANSSSLAAQREAAEARDRAHQAERDCERDRESRDLLQAELTRLREDYRTLQEERLTFLTANASLTTEVAELGRTLDSVRSEATELSLSSQLSNRDRQNTQQDLLTARAALEKLRAKYEGAMAEQAALREEVQRVQAVTELSQRQADELRAANLRHVQTEAILRHDLELAQAARDRVAESSKDLSQRIAGLRAELDIRERELEAKALVAEESEHNARAAEEMKAALSALKAKHAVLKQERGHLLEDLQRLEVQNDTTTEAFEKLRADHTRLVQELAIKTYDCNSALTQQEQLRAELAAIKAELRQCRSDLEERDREAIARVPLEKAARDESQREIEHWKAEFVLESSRVQQLQEQLEQVAHGKTSQELVLSTRCRELEADRQSLQTARDDLWSELAELKRNEATLTARLREAEESATHATGHAERLRGQLDDTNGRVRQLETQVAQQQAAAAATQHILQEHSKRNEDQQRELATWMQQHATLNAQHEILKEKHRQLKETATQSTQEVQRLQILAHTLEELRVAHTELVKENAVLKHEAASAKQGTAALSEELSAEREKASGAQSQLNESVRKTEELQREGKLLHKEVEEMRNRAEEMKREVEHLSTDLRLANQQCAKLEQERVAWEARKAHHHSQLERIRLILEDSLPREAGSDPISGDLDGVLLALASIQEQSRHLRAENNRLKQEAQAIAASAEALREESGARQTSLLQQLAESRQEVDRWRTEAESLSVSTQLSSRDRQANEGELQSLKRENHRCAQELQQCQAEVQRLQIAEVMQARQVEALGSANKNLVRENAVLTHETETLRKERTDAAAERDILGVEVATLRQRLWEVQQQFEQSQRREAELALQLGELKAKYKGKKAILKAELASLAQTPRPQVPQQPQTPASFEEGESEAERVSEAELRALREELGARASRIEELEAELEDVKEQMALTAADTADQHSAAKQLQLLQACEAEISTLRKEGARLQKESKAHSDWVQRLIKEKAEVTREKESCHKAFERQTAEKDAAIADLREQVNSLASSQEALEEEIEAAERVLDRMEEASFMSLNAIYGGVPSDADQEAARRREIYTMSASKLEHILAYLDEEAAQHEFTSVTGKMILRLLKFVIEAKVVETRVTCQNVELLVQTTAAARRASAPDTLSSTQANTTDKKKRRGFFS